VAGDAVTTDPSNPEYVKKAGPGDMILGIVSAKPGMVLSSTAPAGPDATWVPIALVGRVPVNVSTDNGQNPIASGDKLSVDSPGLLHKAQPGDQVAGVALANYTDTADGSISMFVHPEWEGANVSQLQDQFAVSASGFSMVDNNGNPLFTVDSQGSVHVTGTLTADKINASSIEGLQILTDKIDNLSTSVLGANTTDTPSTPVTFNNANFQSVNIALDLNVMGNLFANGGLTVTGDASFLGDVTFGGHIITNGNAPVLVLETALGDTVAPPDNPSEALATASVDGNDSSGELTLNVGTNSTSGELITVNFHKAYAKKPHILVTASNSDASQLKYYVISTTNGFKIVITSAPTDGTNLTFNYLVVQ